MLFLIYINDLEKDVISNVKFFADDTMIFSVVQDPVLSASELNRDLNQINKWAYQWKMAFNPDPTKQAVEVLFSRKNNEIYHPPLYFNNSVVHRVDSHTHLGLTLDSKLIFLNHVNEKVISTTKAVGILRYLRKYLPLNKHSSLNIQNIYSTSFRLW